MSHPPALTILIPVYNGAAFLGGLLESFASFIEAADPCSRDFLAECEILVVNNRSQDATLEIARGYTKRISNLRVVTPDTHVHSAEENVFRSFPLAKGEYTWVLGCDDVVRFESLPDVLQIARDRLYDIAIFNYMLSDKYGRLQRVCNYYMKERIYEGDLLGFTQRMGFWWLIAGFSGQIVRTSLVADFDHAALVKQTSPIYSHVTAYLLCLAGRRAAIVNVPNVVYRMSDDDPDHWRRAAARLQVFDEYFWTLGYIRQLKYLESRGIIGRDFLIKMIENNRDGFFRPTIVIYDKLIAQVELMNAPSVRRNERNVMDRAQFDELIEFFEHRDLLARPFLAAMRKIYEKLQAKRSVSTWALEDARGRLDSYRSSFVLAANCLGVETDYEIYQLANTCLAVHRSFRGAVLDRLRYLDSAELAPIVLTGATRADVVTRISQVGIDLNWDKVPDSLMRYCSEPLAHGAKAWHEPVLPPRVIEHAFNIEGPSIQRIAQHELTTAYKARNPYLTRLVAWLTVLGLKLSKRLTSRTTRRARRVARSQSPSLAGRG